ncbi:STM3941 family protein [Hymenobacter sp. B81]|uniref:STM3941 family protein n=1 Tax=Hymenobacter sp. B81 TaxID=3344878 RepID=UPI0037DD118C
MPEISFYKSRWRAVRVLLLCSVFVVPCGWMVYHNPAHGLGWAGLLFFGLGYPLGLYNLLDRRPQIVLNPVGIFHHEVHRQFINWELIQDAYLVEVHQQQLLCLVVPPDFEPSKRKGRLAQQLGGISRAMGFQELTLPLSATSVDAPRLLKLVLALKETLPAARANLLQEFTGGSS